MKLGNKPENFVLNYDLAIRLDVQYKRIFLNKLCEVKNIISILSTDSMEFLTVCLDKIMFGLSTWPRKCRFEISNAIV